MRISVIVIFVASQMNTDLSQICIISKIDPADLVRLQEGIRDSIIATRRLAEMGWTMPMLLTRRDSVAILESGDDSVVDAAFVSLYSDSRYGLFDQLVQKLTSQHGLVNWLPLIQQSAVAYKHGHFEITIPSLLTILDGLVALSAADQGTQLIRMTQNKVAQLGVTDPPTMELQIWWSIEIFIKLLFSPAPFDGARPQMINRHWILHGRDSTKWAQADSLRLFQALDTLSAVVFQ